MNSPLTPEPFESSKSLLERVEDSLLPLINLVFLLLMFFIVAGQLTDTALPELPGMITEDGGDQPEADLVITAEGDLMANNRVVTLDSLSEHLRIPGDDQPLRVAAAAGTSMSELEALFRVLERNGFEEVILLTEPVE